MSENNESKSNAVVRNVLIGVSHIKVQDRIKELGFLNSTDILNIYSDITINNGYFIQKFKHPGAKKHRSMLTTISHRIAKEYRIRNNRLPDLVEGSRTNYYKEEDYVSFGDNIIITLFYALSEDIRYDKNINQLIKEYEETKENNI